MSARPDGCASQPQRTESAGPNSADQRPPLLDCFRPQHCAVAASLCEAPVRLFPASLAERRLQALEIAAAVSRIARFVINSSFDIRIS